MTWFYLILAGLSEIIWAFGLKASRGFSVIGWSAFTLFFLWVSFYLLARVIRTIPIGTAYAVFTGIGAIGAALVGILLLNESVHPLKLISLAVMIIGIIGLKITDNGHEKEAQS